MHKQIAESRHLAESSLKLIDFINSISEDDTVSIKIKRPRKAGTWQWGSLVHILGGHRHRAEKRYRQKAKRQLSKAVNDPQGDHIVEGIAYCQPWDWRF